MTALTLVISMLFASVVTVQGTPESLPLRATFEDAGANVDWVSGQAVVIMENGDVWVFTPNVAYATLNEEVVHLSTPVVLVNDRMFISANDVAFLRDSDEVIAARDSSHGLMALDFLRHMNDNLPYRVPFSYREQEAALWIADELLAMDFDADAIRIQEFTDADVDWYDPFEYGWELAEYWGQRDGVQLRQNRTSQNVILTIPGQSDSTIVVGAHYDSYAGPGAMDNAAGVALLMESAYHMQYADNYHTLVYVFFGSHELGNWGARYFYDALTQQERDNIVLMINADGIIAGPYLMYAAATGAGPGFEAHPFVVEAILAEPLAEIEAALEQIGLEALLAVMGMDEIGIESPEQLIEILFADIAVPPVAVLAMWEAIPTSTSMQIDIVAKTLSAQNNFEFLAMPNGIFCPVDHIVFLMDGHTVIYLAGLFEMPETASNMEFLLVHEPDNNLFGYVHHTANDNFDYIEALMPGMMLNNLRAFGLFLEGVLLEQFN